MALGRPQTGHDFVAVANHAARAYELTPAQAHVVLPGPAAGHIGIRYRSPDGPEPIGLAVRALMPDEACDPAAF
jgi:hypothetical protein